MPLLPLTQNQSLSCASHMTFQKGNRLGKNQTNQRRDTTIELIAQLNEQTTRKGGKKNTKLQRMISNLIAKATDAFDVLGAEGNIVKEGTGDLQAITEIMNRIDGKPSQKIVGPDNGPLQVEYRTVEEVHMFLLERGIDSLRVPPPPLKLVKND
jgi:hypothetical protein